MFSVGILLQRLVIAVFFVGVIAGLCWYDENIKLQVLSLKIEALIFLAGSLFGVLLTSVTQISHGGDSKNRATALEVSLHSVEGSSALVTKALIEDRLDNTGVIQKWKTKVAKGGNHGLISLKDGNEIASLVSRVRKRLQAVCVQGIVAEDMGVAVVKEIYYFSVTVGAKGDRAEIIVPLANQKALLHAHNNFNPSEPSSADNRLEVLAQMWAAISARKHEENVEHTVESIEMVFPKHAAATNSGVAGVVLGAKNPDGSSLSLKSAEAAREGAIDKLRGALDEVTRKLKMSRDDDDDDLDWTDSEEDDEAKTKHNGGAKDVPKTPVKATPTPIQPPTPVTVVTNKLGAANKGIEKDKKKEEVAEEEDYDDLELSDGEDTVELLVKKTPERKNPVSSKWKDEEEEDYDDLEISDGDDEDDDEEGDSKPLALRLANGSPTSLQPSFTSFAVANRGGSGLKTISLDDFKNSPTGSPISSSIVPTKITPATAKPKPKAPMFSGKTVPVRNSNSKGKTAELLSLRALAPSPTDQPTTAAAAKTSSPSDLVIEIGMVGERGTGKTSLRRRFLYKTFQASPDKDKLKTAQTNVKINSRTITFSVWDQQLQTFVTSACEDFTAFFFIFDLCAPQTLYATMGWQKQVQLLAKRAFVSVLVGTKYDLFSELEEETQIATVAKVRETAEKMRAAGTVFTSSKDDINVSNLFKITLAKVLDLECFVPTASDPLQAVVEYEPRKTRTV